MGSVSGGDGLQSVEWKNDRGGSGRATGTSNWTVSRIPLKSGTNVITVMARDAAGHTASDTLTVTYELSGRTTTASATKTAR